ncbi:NACHT, LRR and PYD domains-containing protein 12-like [Engraulis encrasicolus]|uniref:NACHT, LRR and PYD domains-containing protein 12-like n=1 Tax=Engraulis encrasicolus TaxID=184585 RepID=UPI002FD4BCE9
MGQSDHGLLVQSQCLLAESQCGLCDQVLACPVSSLSCGHRFCEECISRHPNQAGAGTGRDCPGCGRDALRQVMRAHKASLKRRFERIREGHASPETCTLLERVFTELHITEGESESRVNKEHEVRQLEATLRMEATCTGAADTPINCNDIFKPLEGRVGHIKTVLTKGIAGIGKTVSVQKFILDWAQGLSNQDLDFLFVLPLRELNLVKDDHSLHHLLLKFHPELKGLRDLMQYEACQLLFIFDGLDESQLELNFGDTHLVSDIEQTTSVAAVITSLIRSSLLPMACVWITSRPAAADQIPAEYVQRVTEVRGFTDPQKDEYFQKRVADPNKASQILSHLRSSKSLHIMCHIPVFCWISATVLQRVLEHSDAAAIPRTLTEMFIHFLIIQTITSDMKFTKGQDSAGEQGKVLESNRDIVLKLSKLAFEHLEKGSLLFYEEDLRSCGIAVQDAVVYCGMCTEIFRQESLFGQAKVYSFVHVTIQEFLSALFIFQSYIVKDRDALRSFLPENSPTSSQTRGLFKGKSVTQAYDPDLHVLMKGAINRSLECKNGHLDLFLRFLLGIALETNQRLLQGLLTNQRQPQGLLPNHRVLAIGHRTNQGEGHSRGLLPRIENSSRAITKTISYIKDINEVDICPERYINLFHCLLEMNDRSVHEKIQRYLQSGREKRKALRPSQCSALACVLLMSEETMEQLEPRAFNTSEEGRRRLLPAIRCCRRALLADCNLSEQSMEVVLSAVAVGSSALRELDLSGNPLTEPSILLLASLLSSAPCRLDTLKMSGCGLTECGCESLAPVLSSASSCLRVLDLSNNQLCDAGAMQLSTQLQSLNCQLQILRLSSCRISEVGSALLCSVVSQDSRLKELDLRHNVVGQPAANLLLSALLDPHSRLEAIG